MKQLHFGMVGGTGGFIGDVHRRAAAFDGMARLVCGAFSRNPEKNRTSGAKFGVDAARIYDDYRQMAKAERGKLDFVVVVTANTTHFEVCKAFLEQGFNVFCDKPVTVEPQDAETLMRLARENNAKFCVAYTYVGYPMIHQARQLVAAGEVGEILNVVCEYAAKGRLPGLLDGTHLKPGGKYDASVVGKMSAILDIGVHIFFTADFITGLRPNRVLARFEYKPAGTPLETGASVLTEFEGGASGTYWLSQTALGHNNDLRLRVFGTKGALDWCHSRPDQLKFSPINRPVQIYTAANLYNSPESRSLSRIPAGHPEGFTEALANVYRMFCDNVVSARESRPAMWQFPDLAQGALGIKYGDACYRSHTGGNVWVAMG